MSALLNWPTGSLTKGSTESFTDLPNCVFRPMEKFTNPPNPLVLTLFSEAATVVLTVFTGLLVGAFESEALE